LWVKSKKASQSYNIVFTHRIASSVKKRNHDDANSVAEK